METVNLNHKKLEHDHSETLKNPLQPLPGFTLEIRPSRKALLFVKEFSLW